MAKSLRRNFKKEYQLHQACKTEGVDTRLEYIYFRGGYAYASDAYVLVKIPLRTCIEGLEPEDWSKINGWRIHHKMFKLLLGFDIVEIVKGEKTNDDGEVDPTCNINILYAGNTLSIGLERIGNTMPDFDAVLVQSKATPTTAIGVSVGLLTRLSKAMNLPAVKMNFSQDGTRFFVDGPTSEDAEEGAKGLVMAMHLQGVIPGLEPESDDD